MSKLATFLTHLKIEAAAEQALLEVWTIHKTLSRNDFLIQSGQLGRYLYFVKKGTFRIFYPLEHNDAVVGFGYPNTLLFDYPSFVKDRPSPFAIQALSKSEVIGIHRGDFLKIKDQFPLFRNQWHKLTEQALLGRIEREIDLITPSPKARYERLINRSPHVFQLFPHKYIASYLRMTPETLSRLKKEIKPIKG